MTIFQNLDMNYLRGIAERVKSEHEAELQAQLDAEKKLAEKKAREAAEKAREEAARAARTEPTAPTISLQIPQIVSRPTKINPGSYNPTYLESNYDISKKIKEDFPIIKGEKYYRLSSDFNSYKYLDIKKEIFPRKKSSLEEKLEKLTNNETKTKRNN